MAKRKSIHLRFDATGGSVSEPPTQEPAGCGTDTPGELALEPKMLRRLATKYINASTILESGPYSPAELVELFSVMRPDNIDRSWVQLVTDSVQEFGPMTTGQTGRVLNAVRDGLRRRINGAEPDTQP